MKPNPEPVPALPTDFTTDAWLLRGIGHVPGTLRLADGRLSFIARGRGAMWRFQLRELERDCGHVGLAARLERGEAARVFDLPLRELHVVYPWYYFGGGLKLRTPGLQYRISFGAEARSGADNPIAELMEVHRMRSNGKRWRAVIRGFLTTKS